MIKISPSVLTTDFVTLKDDIKRLESDKKEYNGREFDKNDVEFLCKSWIGVVPPPHEIEPEEKKEQAMQPIDDDDLPF